MNRQKLKKIKEKTNNFLQLVTKDFLRVTESFLGWDTWGNESYNSLIKM